MVKPVTRDCGSSVSIGCALSDMDWPLLPSSRRVTEQSVACTVPQPGSRLKLGISRSGGHRSWSFLGGAFAGRHLLALGSLRLEQFEIAILRLCRYLCRNSGLFETDLLSMRVISMRNSSENNVWKSNSVFSFEGEKDHTKNVILGQYSASASKHAGPLPVTGDVCGRW